MNTKKIYILIVFLILSFEININAKESFFLEGVKLFEKKKLVTQMPLTRLAPEPEMKVGQILLLDLLFR